jgi:2,3-bisphosphoglycerate-independent phosphoglycerate mutase
MDETDPRKLQHQVELAERAASLVSDQTTAQRLKAFANDVRNLLQRQLTARRRRREVSARAHELWERAGPPSGRDQEFWFQAEDELKNRGC